MISNAFQGLIIGFLLYTSQLAQASPAKYIVKFDDQVLPALSKKSGLLTHHDYFYSEIQSILGSDSVQPSLNFTFAFNGASFEVFSPDSASIELIKSLPIVERIWEDTVHSFASKPNAAEDSNKKREPFNPSTIEPSHSFFKRGLTLQQIEEDLLELKYSFLNQTLYYESCTLEYIPNPPPPPSNAPKECFEYYNYGWNKNVSPGSGPSCSSNTPSSTIASVLSSAISSSTYSPTHIAIQNLANLPPTPWTPFNDTGVPQVQAEGLTGKNVVIGFLDTGVDFTHPALASHYLGGYDFVGDNYDGYNQPQPKPIPDDTNGHGTSAAGIALGKSPTFVGVAPDAKFYMYRVFSNSFVSTDEIVLSGLELAVKDGVDIISVSAGDASAFGDTPFSYAVDAIVSQGIIVVFSAGNNGAYGPYYGSGGAASPKAIAVGETQTNKLITWPAYIVSDKSPIPKAVNYISTTAGILPLNGVHSVDYVNSSFCTPDGFPERNNSILLIPFAKNAECSRNQQYSVASYLGYEYAIYIEEDSLQYLYNSASGISGVLQAAATIPYTNGLWLAEQYGFGASFQLVFNSSSYPETIPTNITGAGYIRPESCWGPTYDGFFVPDIVAPGGNVFAPILNNLYSSVAGSSFSCPYVAGIAALYLQKNGISKSAGHPAGRNVPGQFKNAIVSYGKPLDWFDGNNVEPGFPAPLIQQGGGLVDAYGAILSGKSIVDTPYLVVNSSEGPFSFNYFEFNLKNEFHIPVTYTLESLPAVVVNDRNDTTLISNIFPPPVYPDNDRLFFYNKEYIVLPGSSVTVKLGVTLDSDPIFQNAIYTGKVVLKASYGPDLGVPYMAFAENTYKTVPVIAEPLIVGTADPNTGEFTPSAPNDTSFQISQGNIPYLGVNINFGTLEYSVDLVTEDFDLSTDFSIELIYPGYRQKRGLFPGFTKRAPAPSGASKYFGPISLGDGNDYPSDFNPRQIDSVEPFAGLVSNNTIKPGTYRLLQRAVRPFGNRYKTGDWQLVLSDPISLS